MRRILLAVNILIAIAILAACGVFYWYLYRALPQTSGSIEARVGQTVEVTRDSLGVPHIKAKSMEDVLFVQGYVTAEDRMWQMDSLRRLAAGELSEIIGPAGLEADRDARRLRMRRMAEQIYITLSDADKASFAAYSRGVNAYIESHAGRYGVEFTLLKYDPQPWSTVDSLLIGLQMYRTLANDWKTKLVKAKMLGAGEPEKVGYLFPAFGGGEFMPGGDAHPGSNAWAVSGAHSASGRPLLSNDMHLEFSMPGLWYQAQMQAPGLNVEGVALPGVPGIIVGHNDRIAWGDTNLGFSVQDLYLEKMDARNGRYLFKGNVEQARQEREVIAVKGRGAEELTVWTTRHGPVLQEVNGSALSLRWTAADPAIFRNIFPDVDRARNWEEFKTALSQLGGPAQNFVYADVDGNIGYHAAGKLPIRLNYAGDVPVDGAAGESEWNGYIPFDELPQAYNPKEGFVVTANQNPFPAGYGYKAIGQFAPSYRSRQILNMLRASGNKMTAADGLRIEKDVYSGFHKFIAGQIVAAYDKHGASDAHFSAAVDLLRKWNGQMDEELPQPLITTLIYQYIRSGMAERASPGSGALYETQISAAVTERLLRERPADWFGDYTQFLLQSLTDAVGEATRLQGPDPNRWKWGKYMYLEAFDPVVARVPYVGKYFSVGPAPMSGGSTTVKQTTNKLGPSERMNVSVGKWDDSSLNLPFGESGHVASRHWRDQWDAYYAGQSFPMQFQRVDAKSAVMFVPLKQP